MVSHIFDPLAPAEPPEDEPDGSLRDTLDLTLNQITKDAVELYGDHPAFPAMQEISAHITKENFSLLLVALRIKGFEIVKKKG